MNLTSGINIITGEKLTWLYSVTEIPHYGKVKTSRWYPYFDVVIGLTWSYDPESYAAVA
jgi:hypothetical protein